MLSTKKYVKFDTANNLQWYQLELIKYIKEVGRRSNTQCHRKATTADFNAGLKVIAQTATSLARYSKDKMTISKTQVRSIVFLYSLIHAWDGQYHCILPTRIKYILEAIRKLAKDDVVHPEKYLHDMQLTKEANEQEKVIRRMNIGIPSVLAYAKVSVNQYHATQDTEMKQLLYYQIIDCTKEVLDTLSVLFFDNFAQIVIANKEERKEYVPRYVVEKTLVDVRSLIVFLCEEAKNGSSFRLSTKAWEEIVDVLWVDSIGIPVSLVGRFNAILDITKSNKYVGYIANQGYCEFIDKNDYLARKTSME